jgi:hypothetical protein
MVTPLLPFKSSRCLEHRASVVLISSMPSNVNHVFGTSNPFSVAPTVTSSSSSATTLLSSTLASCVFCSCLALHRMTFFYSSELPLSPHPPVLVLVGLRQGLHQVALPVPLRAVSTETGRREATLAQVLSSLSQRLFWVFLRAQCLFKRTLEIWTREHQDW